MRENHLPFGRPVLERPHSGACLCPDIQHSIIYHPDTCPFVCDSPRLRIRRINGRTNQKRRNEPTKRTDLFVGQFLLTTRTERHLYRYRPDYVAVHHSDADRQYRAQLQCHLASKTSAHGLPANNRLFFDVIIAPLVDCYLQRSDYLHDHVCERFRDFPFIGTNAEIPGTAYPVCLDLGNVYWAICIHAQYQRQTKTCLVSGNPGWKCFSGIPILLRQ